MKLKSYTCSKCGSVLNVETSQRILDCPFCGNTFRTVSFHRKEVLQQAANNLRRSEFQAADDKYQEILVDDPGNFDALLGRLYCAARIPSSDKLSNIRTAAEYDMRKSIRMIRDLPAYPSSDASSYFVKLDELLKKAKRYKELQTRIAKLRAENKAEYEKISQTTQEEEGIRETSRKTGTLIIALLGFCIGGTSIGEVPQFGLVLLGLALWIFMIYKIGPLIGTLIFLAIFAVIFILFLRASNKLSRKYAGRGAKYREETTANHTQFLELDQEMSDLEQSYAAGYAELKKLRPSVPVGPQDPRKIEKPEVFSDEKKTVYCSKCGGELALDRERSLYTCKYCGVASGASLFIGNVFLKANRALSAGEFEEAELRFSHNLMMHPDDFDSLLGRILAEGRWTSLDQFTLECDSHIPPFRIKNLLARAEEAKTHAKEEDKEFFSKFEKMVITFRDAEEIFAESDEFKEDNDWVVKKYEFDVLRGEVLKYLSERSA